MVAVIGPPGPCRPWAPAHWPPAGPGLAWPAQLAQLGVVTLCCCWAGGSPPVRHRPAPTHAGCCREAAPEVLKSQIVKEAPPAMLSASTGDVSAAASGAHPPAGQTPLSPLWTGLLTEG